MEKDQSPKSIVTLLTQPDALERALNDPKNFGLEAYNSLNNSQKQYLAFAAGAGLIIYGFILGRKK